MQSSKNPASLGTAASPETVSGDTVRTTIRLLPGNGKRVDMLKLMPTKVASTARVVANTAKAEEGAKVNNAANSQAYS